ncbi:MAG: membrane lipoprotein lipid attachment site-containing protein [Tenericutes bacterium]|nr:membrane lipoprotein lipid attachment site-containing protein [Mycoplasmatota bacterium]
MKKIILLFMFTILLTGCSCDYELNISDDKVVENVDISLPYSMDSDDRSKFLEYTKVDNLAVVGGLDNPYYDMSARADNYGDVYNFNYSYDKEHPIKNARTMQSCFEKYKVEETSSYYMFVFRGEFKCKYKFDDVNITVKTNNMVPKHNSTDYDEKEGVYRWKIDSSNASDVDIKLLVQKDKYPEKIKEQSNNLFINIFLIVGILVSIVGGIIFTKKVLNAVDNFQK